MSNIYIGFLLGFVSWLAVFGLVAFAHVRLSRLERGLHDIDWQVLSDLTLDVAKLKKSAQKWQNNENAAQKMSHQDMLQQALIEHQMQNSAPQRPRIVER